MLVAIRNTVSVYMDTRLEGVCARCYKFLYLICAASSRSREVRSLRGVGALNGVSTSRALVFSVGTKIFLIKTLHTY